MSAEIIELHPGLKRLPPDPDSRSERAKDAVMNVWLAVEEPVRMWLGRSPIVVVRRSSQSRLVRSAFVLGQESGRAGYRR